MKRVRIMLMSLALVAIIGSVFAFTAAKRSQDKVCTTATILVNGVATCAQNGLAIFCNNVPPTFTITYTPSAQGTRCATTVEETVTNCGTIRCPLKVTTVQESQP